MVTRIYIHNWGTCRHNLACCICFVSGWCFLHFSSPDVIQLLNLPEAVNAAGTKQQHSGKKQKQIAKQSDGKSQEETPGQQEMVAEQVQDDR